MPNPSGTPMRWLILLLALAVGWYGFGALRQARLHTKIAPADVQHVAMNWAMNTPSRATAEESELIVRWFNEARNPRRDRDNMGHTTTVGVVFITLTSGERVDLRPEGQDFAAGQRGNYYYLEHPQLAALLRSLDRVNELRFKASGGGAFPETVREIFSVRVTDSAGAPLRGATVRFPELYVDTETNETGIAGPFIIAVPAGVPFPYRIEVSKPGCPETSPGAPGATVQLANCK